MKGMGRVDALLPADPGRELVLALLTNRTYPNWSWVNPDPVRVEVANVLADAPANACLGKSTLLQYMAAGPPHRRAGRHLAAQDRVRGRADRQPRFPHWG
ncbi:MAG: hypothetical protein JXA67_00965 [Micromonosporaceae bacterium]|nr:hypothetical protein [Micromonosporaceae bacterium]